MEVEFKRGGEGDGVRPGIGPNRDGMGHLFRQRPVRRPDRAADPHEGCALLHRFEPSLGGGEESRAQFGNLRELGAIRIPRGAPSMGQQNGIGASGPVKEDRGQPCLQRVSRCHVARRDRPFKPMGIAECANRIGGGQPSCELKERCALRGFSHAAP